MKRVCLFILVVTCLAATVVGGCGVRTEVAKQLVVDKVDSMLGDIEVKRRKIDSSIHLLQKSLTQVRKAKIKAQVKRDQIMRKVDFAEENMQKLDTTLSSIRVRLTSGESTEIDGEAYSHRKLKQMTQKVLEERDIARKQVEGFQATVDRLGKIVQTLERNESKYLAKLADVKHQVAVIDSNRIAMTAMQEAAQTMDGSDVTFAENVATLEDQVNDLYADVEAELLSEDMHWQDNEMDDAEQIVSTLATSDDLISQIDSILPESRLTNVVE
ncbi:hypothetical protein OAG76_05585 [Rubripirellula sp.]|nr:hypothetical protein [Rubripirellula sp.]MDB4634859.1 hypothetical protein [Rubripirellula sp.]MDC0288467.1 hypothetical protein [Rubripirellula sp.]